MKKVFSLLLALSMLITGSFGVMAQAQTIEPTNFDEINFQITSKENPDAYIESRFVPGNSAYARSSEEDGKTLVGYVDATVYVEETYTKGEDGNIFTTDSRLLSEEEVMSIGKSEFDVPVQSVQPRISTIGDKTTSRGKLTIRFTVMAYSQARRYQLNLTGCLPVIRILLVGGMISWGLPGAVDTILMAMDMTFLTHLAIMVERHIYSRKLIAASLGISMNIPQKRNMMTILQEHNAGRI